MPANARITGSETTAADPGFRLPEAEELDRKRSELRSLQDQLADAELGLASLRSQLIAFQRRYLEVVGSRYAELDRLEALIANRVASQHPEDHSASQQADAARARSQESANAMGDSAHGGTASDFVPTEELQRLYRRAACELHPDLTTDEEESTRRTKAMAEVNKAFESCDADRIRRILDEWRSSPDHVRGDDTAAQLVRAIRQIAQVTNRLRAIKAETEELVRGELYCLRKQVEDAAIRGQDLLAQIAGQLDAQIEQARARIKETEEARHARG